VLVIVVVIVDGGSIGRIVVEIVDVGQISGLEATAIAAT